jgi:DNA-binding MarR family transcriptional regulator
MSGRAKQKYSPTPLLHLAFILQQSAEDLLLKEGGISLSYVRILGALDTQVPSSQRTLAHILHQTEANISRQLLLMVRQRLVKITKNKNDARQRDVTLTAAGARKYQEAEKMLKNNVSLFLKGALGVQKKNFEDLVIKINTSI